jgi:hypothetical protein
VLVENYIISEKIKKLGRLDVDLKIRTPCQQGNYHFQIIATHLSRKIECRPLNISLEVKSEKMNIITDESESDLHKLLTENPHLNGMFSKEVLYLYLFLKSEKGVSLNEFIKLMSENANNTEIIMSKFFYNS